ncbi:hypothetical protein TNCV_1649631 [Trichonephila clavipes]|nr:hypothetical protein TNCV_1649631 [Trichonephila clavipes]
MTCLLCSDILTTGVPQPPQRKGGAETMHGQCNVTSPNIKSGRHLCWTRHPHVHLAAAAQPLFDPRGIEHRRPEDEGRDALNLHGSGGQRILLSQNIGL